MTWLALLGLFAVVVAVQLVGLLWLMVKDRRDGS